MTRMYAKAATGALLLLVLVALGLLSLTSTVTHLGLQVDADLVGVRSGTLTTVAEGLTTAAQEAVGLGALLVGLIVLVLWRRRFDALRLLCMAGGAWVAAMLVKDVLDRPRPPASLWLVPPDPTGSFPSGHATTATVIALIAYTVFRCTRAKGFVVALGVVFMLAVGASRLYLGDHYPVDVLGSYLTVTAAALLVSAVADLGFVRRLAAGILRTPEITAPDGRAAGGVGSAKGGHRVDAGRLGASPKSVPK